MGKLKNEEIKELKMKKMEGNPSLPSAIAGVTYGVYVSIVYLYVHVYVCLCVCVLLRVVVCNGERSLRRVTSGETLVEWRY